MTAIQAFGIGFIATAFIGSLILGRYLRLRDERKDAAEAELASVHSLAGTKGQVSVPIEAAMLKDEISIALEYYGGAAAEIMWGYNLLAIIHGEDYAEEWKSREFERLRQEILALKAN